jgi:hypothetical protein
MKVHNFDSLGVGTTIGGNAADILVEMGKTSSAFHFGTVNTRNMGNVVTPGQMLQQTHSSPVINTNKKSIMMLSQ